MKIAIDGPAGAGKSTVAQRLAVELGLRYLDTGAMYRAVTLQALRKGICFTDDRRLARLVTAMDLRIDFEPGTGKNRVFIDGEDVTDVIRQPEISENVSLVSSHKRVRELVVALQQEIAKAGSIIMDGRDIGTVVMPDAEWKFFLEASVRERAKRRQLQLRETGYQVGLLELEEQIRRRDLFDSTRDCSPLQRAEGAIELDTTFLGIGEVVEALLCFIREGTPGVQDNSCHS